MEPLNKVTNQTRKLWRVKAAIIDNCIRTRIIQDRTRLVGLGLW